MPNPFHIHGVVTRPHFTDREAELARMVETLSTPGAKLLVYGERRMGKTSALRVAMAEHAEAGGSSCLADFSTATSHADLANRILSAASRSLGRRWRDMAHDLAGRLGMNLELGVDPVTGTPTASLGMGLRDSAPTEQRETLARVLDAVEGLCRSRDATLGLVLDEFQEIHRFGGEEAEWHLRGIIQHHQAVSYIVAGSRTHLIRRMISKGGAFYKLFDLLSFGPIAPDHLADWIEARMKGGGIEGPTVGAFMIRLVGPRTRDVVQLARKSYDLAMASKDTVGEELVERALVEVVQEEDDPLLALWDGYSATQQKVLRAVADGTESLTSSDTLRRFGLRSSAGAAQAAAGLVERGTIEQVAPGHYRFDSPFQRAWVVMRALPDVGIHRRATWMGDEVDRA